MKTRLLFVPLLLALVASLAACGGGATVSQNDVAMVGSDPITRTEFNTFFQQALKIAESSPGAQKVQPGSTQYTSIQAQTLAYLVQVHELELQAPKENVSVSQAEVTKYLQNLANTSYKGSMKKLEAALKAQGLSMDTARQEVYVNLLAQKIHTKVTSSASVTAGQVRAYYTINLSQYTTPAATTRSVQYILFRIKPDGSDKAAKKSLAESVLTKLKNGASFAAMAKQYSDDSSTASTGGKITMTKGKVVPAFEQAALALRTGALSGVVDATSAANQSYGYFIIKALAPTKTVKAHTTPFKQVEASIKSTILSQQQDKLWQQWLSDLKSAWADKVTYQEGYAPPTTTALTDTSTIATG